MVKESVAENPCDISEEYLQNFCWQYIASFLASVMERTKELNISMYELARRTGVDYAALYRIFKAQRNPSVETLLRLACVLDIDLSIEKS